MKLKILDKEINLNPEGDKAILAVCVGIAFIFWFFAKMSNKYSSDRVVEVEYMLPQGKAFSELPAEKLKATFEGSGWDLMKDYLFGAKKIVKVDLSRERPPGIDQATLLSRISDLSLNKRKLKITKTIPSTLYLDFKNEQRKRIPVRLKSDITFAPGYFRTAEPLLIPDSIDIFGAKSLLDTISYWETVPVTYQDQKDSFRVQVRLAEKLPRLIRLSQRNTDMEVPIEKWTEKKIYADIRAINAPDSLLTLFPKQIETTFTVPLSRFARMTVDSFSIIADLQNVPLNTVNNTVPVLVEKQPQGIRGLTINPKVVQFFVENQSEEE